jgi:hypothetical protein
VQKCTEVLHAVHAAKGNPGRLPIARKLVGMLVSRDTIFTNVSDLSGLAVLAYGMYIAEQATLLSVFCSVRRT